MARTSPASKADIVLRLPEGLRGRLAQRELAPGAWQVELSLEADSVTSGAVEVALRLGAAPQRWLIPGCFYGGDGTCPRWSPSPETDGALVSDHWYFRADRASHPAVFGWTAERTLCLATQEVTAIGPAGLGFSGGWDDGEVRLHFPAAELPVSFQGCREPGPAQPGERNWSAGERAMVRFFVFDQPSSPSAYAPILRLLYERQRKANPLNPWMSPSQAAGLAAEGLVRWHWRPALEILAETVGFEPGAGGRDHMHVAWLSGAPAAAGLLAHGRRAGRDDEVLIGSRVLDRVAGALAPCGTFWGQWTAAGWTSGWNRPGLLQARTAAEACLFMGRALRAERDLGYEHPEWEAAVASSLDWSERTLRADGALPSYFDATTGAGTDWEGTGALLWVAVLAENGRLQAAEHVAAYYAPLVLADRLSGAPEDVRDGPTSEDGYNAIIAYVAVHLASGRQRWLDVARHAAAWTMTFRWTYNLAWEEHTLLGAHDFRSRGADAASPANPHLHAYGLICLPELLRLAELTGDRHWRDRARDNLACFLQMIARSDGDFTARRGMATERYYNTDCFGPKGGLLPVSHAWCLGLLVHACLAGDRLMR